MAEQMSMGHAEQYLSFMDSVRKNSIVPILNDDRTISIYRFSFTEATKEILDSLIEERQIGEHTDLVGVSPYYPDYNLGTLTGKHELDIESFKKFCGLDSGEAVENYKKKYLLPGEDFDHYYSRVSNCIKVEYYPTVNKKVQSSLSIFFENFCKYADFDVLYQAIDAYLSGNKPDYFNKIELDVTDKRGLIMELLKSLDVELLYSTNVYEENNYVLSRLFNINYDDFGDQSRAFILEYSRHNYDMIFNSNLSSLFNELMLLSSGNSIKK